MKWQAGFCNGSRCFQGAPLSTSPSRRGHAPTAALFFLLGLPSAASKRLQSGRRGTSRVYLFIAHRDQVGLPAKVQHKQPAPLNPPRRAPCAPTAQVRCLRPDRVIFAATSYVANSIGRKFVEPPVLDLAETYLDSSPLTPLVFVLSAGVDPTDSLRKLAAEKGVAHKWVASTRAPRARGGASCRRATQTPWAALGTVKRDPGGTLLRVHNTRATNTREQHP